MSPRQSRTDYVRSSLMSQLRSSRYLAGDKLPNEDELAKEFEVSRVTVREAVRGLIEAGYLTASTGSARS